MEKQLQEILNTLYEAEALLEMALRRAPRGLENLASLARRKCFQAADLAAALELNEKPEESTCEATAEELPVLTPCESASESQETDVAEQLFLEKVAPELPAEQSERQEEAEEQEETLATLPEETPAEEDADDVALAEEEEEEEGEEAEAAPEREEKPEPQRNRRPIATFFSINDKFRFRRELFGGSNPEWLDALALLETMNDMAEANDYLFDDLQWDPESPDVKAFIAVLERYYNS